MSNSDPPRQPPKSPWEKIALTALLFLGLTFVLLTFHVGLLFTHVRQHRQLEAWILGGQP